MTKDGKVKQRQHFYNHGDIICYPEAGYRLCNNQTARKVYMYVDATIMQSSQTELFSSFLPSTYVGHGNLAAAKHWQFMPNWKNGSTVEFIIVRV